MTVELLAFWFMLIRAILSGMALVAGLYSIRIGYRLFQTGYGAAADKSKIVFGRLNVSVNIV